MTDAAEQTQEQLDAEFPHICQVLKVQRVTAGLATLMDDTMKLAAAKLGVDVDAPEEWQRKSARRYCLTDIFGSYDARPTKGVDR